MSLSSHRSGVSAWRRRARRAFASGGAPRRAAIPQPRGARDLQRGRALPLRAGNISSAGWRTGI